MFEYLGLCFPSQRLCPNPTQTNFPDKNLHKLTFQPCTKAYQLSHAGRIYLRKFTFEAFWFTLNLMLTNADYLTDYNILLKSILLGPLFI